MRRTLLSPENCQRPLEENLRHLAVRLPVHAAGFQVFLQACTCLESLVLSRVADEWSQEEQYQFFTFLGGLGTVVQLEIDGNLEALTLALPHWTSLTELDLSHFLQTPEFPRQLACLSQLRTLKLVSLKFKAEDLPDLDESFAQLTQLTSLNLYHTRFLTASDPVFVFRHCLQLRKLCLPAVMVHSEHADLLKSALWPLTKLQALQVGWFSPQGAAWEVFCTHLQRCTDLQSLDWSQSGYFDISRRYPELALVTKVRLMEVTDYLPLATLTRLNLAYATVDLEEWTQFCHQILPQCTQLVKLDLTNPNFSLLEFCEPFFESVVRLTALEQLWFVSSQKTPPRSYWEQLQQMVESMGLIACGCNDGFSFLSATIRAFNGGLRKILRRNRTRRRSLFSYAEEAEEVDNGMDKELLPPEVWFQKFDDRNAIGRV